MVKGIEQGSETGKVLGYRGGVDRSKTRIDHSSTLAPYLAHTVDVGEFVGDDGVEAPADGLELLLNSKQWAARTRTQVNNSGCTGFVQHFRQNRHDCTVRFNPVPKDAKPFRQSVPECRGKPCQIVKLKPLNSFQPHSVRNPCVAELQPALLNFKNRLPPSIVVDGNVVLGQISILPIILSPDSRCSLLESSSGG